MDNDSNATLERIAVALERIADSLENENKYTILDGVADIAQRMDQLTACVDGLDDALRNREQE